ncbi:FUSC family protein [Mycobacterium terramassiliense]|uniref:Membrane protein-like protein n=1 Tax=Mycobacterium terramassiliense TaxID=1841859 RepID=A0A2U3NF09_9MYCO|nr:FUSC family protein [Mycobacterium terramassiliense]SPM30085.1 membrane protein-like protein [Mycobacterium terramassiliense]
MLTRVSPIRRAMQVVRDTDPERDGLRRAVRAAIMVPATAGFAFGVVGGKAVPLYALLGAFWLLVVTEFPGNRQQRAVAYLGLAVNGFVLITLGTLVAPIAPLAVTLMFFLGVAVVLAGMLSATMSAGLRATLLCYVWPVCTPVGPVGERLLGWLIAVAICVPAALYLLPPRHYGALRRHVALVCGALADRIEGVGSAEDVAAAMDELRANFLAASFRPVGLSAGSRALVRVVDVLELVADLVDDDTGVTLGAVAPAAVDVLRSCARLLDASQLPDRAANRAVLDEALPRLRSSARHNYREDVALILGAKDDASAIETGRLLLGCRIITTTIALTGRVIAAAAAADARPVWARALGLQLPPTGFADRLSSETAAGATIVTGFLAARSVAAHNGLRMGVGLALAVAVTHLHLVEHGFWVVVGTMVVLSSSALSTRTKVFQAVAGTTLGIALGGVLVGAVGSVPAVLWLLVPVTVFGSTYLPRFLSFTAAQAMSALSLLVILNLTAPAGWHVGLLRIEDIAMGAAVGMAVSLLLWPRGATAAVASLIGAAVDVNVRYLQVAVLRVVRDRPQHPPQGTEGAEGADGHLAALSHDALVGGRRVDDAVRHYLSETGSGADLRTPVVRAANRATWLRLAADMVADVRTLPPSGAYPAARAVLKEHLQFVTQQASGRSDAASRPMAGEVARALRAEAIDQVEPVEAAQPFVTVAATLSQLELILQHETDSATTSSISE